MHRSREHRRYSTYLASLVTPSRDMFAGGSTRTAVLPIGNPLARRSPLACKSVHSGGGLAHRQSAHPAVQSHYRRGDPGVRTTNHQDLASNAVPSKNNVDSKSSRAHSHAQWFVCTPLIANVSYARQQRCKLPRSNSCVYNTTLPCSRAQRQN